jgi:hypothetical protein
MPISIPRWEAIWTFLFDYNLVAIFISETRSNDGLINLPFRQVLEGDQGVASRNLQPQIDVHRLCLCAFGQFKRLAHSYRRLPL